MFKKQYLLGQFYFRMSRTALPLFPLFHEQLAAIWLLVAAIQGLLNENKLRVAPGSRSQTCSTVPLNLQPGLACCEPASETWSRKVFQRQTWPYQEQALPLQTQPLRGSSPARLHSAAITVSWALKCCQKESCKSMRPHFNLTCSLSIQEKLFWI